jgi:acetyltransferase-like isoleucine patch superfamily enzyme
MMDQKPPVQRNVFKLAAKAAACSFRGLGGFGKNTYVSPLAELRFPARIRLADHVVLERHARLTANGAKASIEIGDVTTIFPYALLNTDGGRIRIGRFCAVHDYAVIYGYGGVTIGDDVHIAAHTVIVASEHDPALLGTDRFSRDVSGRGIHIEESVWIGANAVILDGVRIGRGSVIGAGAVVSRDIPAHTLALGVPARAVKQIGRPPL